MNTSVEDISYFMHYLLSSPSLSQRKCRSLVVNGIMMSLLFIV